MDMDCCYMRSARHSVASEKSARKGYACLGMNEQTPTYRSACFFCVRGLLADTPTPEFADYPPGTTSALDGPCGTARSTREGTASHDARYPNMLNDTNVLTAPFREDRLAWRAIPSGGMLHSIHPETL